MAADNFLYFPTPAVGGFLSNASANKPQGESTDSWFSSKGAVELASFGFGISQAETTGSATTGSAAGKAKFDEFTIEKDVDQSSASLFLACTAGAHFPAIQLICRKPGGQNLLYVQFTFGQVFVTGVNWSGGGGEENPKESIKFKFGAMGIQYIQQLASGLEGKKMSAWWSTVNNTPTSFIPDGGTPPPFLDGAQS
jgi:type VI secretion system secreted protein Hcp